MLSQKKELSFSRQTEDFKLQSYSGGMGSTLNSQNVSHHQISMQSQIQNADPFANDSFHKSFKSIFNSLKTDNFSKNEKSLLKDIRQNEISQKEEIFNEKLQEISQFIASLEHVI